MYLNYNILDFLCFSIDVKLIHTKCKNSVSEGF